MNNYFFIGLFFTLFTYSQSETGLPLNEKYLEDQLYIGITYNLLDERPNGINLRGFSNTLLVGYIRDIPFNKKRNLGVGIGLGYSRSNYFHNMKIVKLEDRTYFSDFADTEVYSSNTNKLVFNTIDLPFEFRIRNSTPEKNKFFRLYLGMKVSYVFRNKSQFMLNQDEKQKFKNFDNFNPIHYGLTISSGVGTWNGYLYYGLTNLFDKAKFNETDSIETKSIRFGLIFYVL